VAEAANSKLKRDIKSQGPLSSHSVVLQTLSFCVGCWLKPARASDDGKPVGLLGETSVSRPPGPDEWMLQKDGRYLRPPFAKDMMWVPSVCRILQLMRKWKESHDEYQHGNFKYLVMAVGQPTKVPHGLAVRMRDMLKCQKITVLQEKLMSEGIVADEDGELVFDIDAWDKIWGKYALIWHNGDPAHPVRCSCWMWSFRNHCVHAWLGLLQRKRVCGSGQFTDASMRVLSMLELGDVNGNKPTLTNQRKLGSNTSELRMTFTWCN
jgi:hypothetical protein